jgi:hypothetical protein
MALVEKFHVVAAERPVASGETIKEGMIVSLNSSGEVVRQSSSYKIPYGLAGDTKSTTASSMPGVASGWQNRASDYFDETRASGKMTVYHSGGEFATDQFASNVSSKSPMQLLYGYNGLLDSNDGYGTTLPVARLTQAAAAYPSGVPGTDTTADADRGDIKLSGDNSSTYIEIKLLI